MKTIIDGGGRIQIPKDLRHKYNLEKGSSYNMTDCNGYIKIEPMQEIYNINTDEMTALRKLYLMLAENSLLDEYYDLMLSNITKKTESKCPECNSPLFLNKDNTYKCYKCGDE